MHHFSQIRTSVLREDKTWKFEHLPWAEKEAESICGMKKVLKQQLIM